MPDDVTMEHEGLGMADDIPEVDPEVARALGVTEDELKRQPGWKKLKMGNLAEKVTDAQRKADGYRAALEEQRRMNQELAERLSRLEQNGSAKAREPEPEGLAKYPMAELKEAKIKAQRALHAAAINPEDEEARKQAALVTPELMDSLDEEIRRRERQEDLKGLRSELGAKEQRSAAEMRFKQRLVSKFGNEALDPTSDLFKRASEMYREKATEWGVQDDNGALTVLAFEEAYREIRGRDRGGRGSEADLRRLAVESQTRREVETHNVIAALKKQGDWKADVKANQIELGQWLEHQRGAGRLR